MCVRWRPLLKHSRKRFWKFCVTRCSMLRETAATPSLMFCFKSTVVLPFFSYTLILRYSRWRIIPTRDIHSDEYWGADEISTESQRQNHCFFNPLKPELNPICYLLALLAHHFLHVSRIRVKSLTFRSLTLYMYWAPILDVSRSHTTTQHSR